MINSKTNMLFDKIYPYSYHPYILKKLDMFIAFGLFFVSLVVYLKTLNPSVTAGDSGELITTVYNMGASHPPGFPLYGIIGKLFTFLRFSDIGYKLNLFSAVSAAVAVLFGYLTLVKLLGFNRKVQGFSWSVHFPAIAAILVFAFSKAHWSQAVMAEVYALNVALTSLLFFVMILWYEEIMYHRYDQNLWLAPRMTLLLAFVMGLSITNHQIPVWYIIAWMLLLFPIIYLLISLKGSGFEQQFRQRIVPISIFAIVCGIALILLVVSAIKPYLLFPGLINDTQYRLVFPEHVPYILTAILCVPAWLTLYTLQSFTYSQQVNRIHTVFSKVCFVLLWVILLFITALYFYFLNPAAALLISIPYIGVVCYQLIHKNDIYKAGSENWVDKFFFILTAAMWLLVFAVSIYLYMWIRAKAIAPLAEPKPLTWGDTQTIDILVNHLLRKQYPVGDDDYTNLGGQLIALVQYHISQFGVINTILGVFGIAYFVKKEPIQGTYFVLATTIYLWSIVDFINFEVNPRSLETQEVFFIQQFLVYSFFIGFAYQLILDLPKLLTMKEAFFKEEL
ncbi:MAG: glycosyltransferase family 117 protein [Brevinemataceae bacterium]